MYINSSYLDHILEKKMKDLAVHKFLSVDIEIFKNPFRMLSI